MLSESSVYINKIDLLNEAINFMSNFSITAKFAQLWDGHTSSSRGTAPPSSESEECSTHFCQKKKAAKLSTYWFTFEREN